jgi:hypothetical protein
MKSNKMADSTLAGSFRDPSGFLFHSNGVLYRQVNGVYQPHYDRLMQSGLYAKLVEKGLLVPHVEQTVPSPQPESYYKIIKPELVPFISYPYEWSFSQLRDAALLTLQLHAIALEHDMVLKDASAYNVQFYKGKPVFIDTLSFANYHEGAPWVAYRQFCQYFLAPLALMAKTDIRLQQLLRVYIDGMPLDLTSRLLPAKTKFQFGLLSHIHMHAKSEKHYADKTDTKARSARVSRLAMRGLLDNLKSTILKLSWQPQGTEWADYYNDTNYSDKGQEQKKELVRSMLRSMAAKTVWDLGANTGVFSTVAAEIADQVLSFDIDPAAVEKNYLVCRQKKQERILPLLLDLTNPSAGIGWDLTERHSLIERGPADAILALALIHHLAIGNNVPLPRIAAFFQRLADRLIIEFVPKTDSQVSRLLVTREDIFVNYTQQDFEQAFQRYYVIEEKTAIVDSQRTLYRMKRRV